MKKESMLNRNVTCEVDPSTICQFTGLTDKNGTPIYEGDIVTYKDNNAFRRGIIDGIVKLPLSVLGAVSLSTTLLKI